MFEEKTEMMRMFVRRGTEEEKEEEGLRRINSITRNAQAPT